MLYEVMRDQNGEVFLIKYYGNERSWAVVAKVYGDFELALTMRDELNFGSGYASSPNRESIVISSKSEARKARYGGPMDDIEVMPDMGRSISTNREGNDI